MNIKTRLIQSSIAILISLVAPKIGFAQQPTSSQKTETVIFKLQKSDCVNKETSLEKSLIKINGIAINKFCDFNNKIFLILEVNRTLQPDDNNIINVITTHQIGYKKVDSSNEVILNSCN